MAYSIIEVVGNGTSQYPINFTLGFNSRTEVQCRVNDEVDGLDGPVYRDLTWINDGLVEVAGGPFTGSDSLRFTRTVDKSELIHDYSNGEPIEELNLDQSNKQNLFAIQEILDGRLEAPLANNLDMGGYRITNLADGIDPQDAVTMGQVDLDALNASVAAAAESADEAETSNLSAGVHDTNAAVSAAAAALSAMTAAAAANGMKFRTVRFATTTNDSLSGLSARDGVTPVAGDRCLVKNHATAANCGIYTAASGSWTRATDMDTWDEVPGTVVVVQEGSTLADKVFLCTANEGGTLGSTAIAFVDWGVALLDASVSGSKLVADIALAGNPTTTTQSAATNNTTIATTAFTQAAIQQTGKNSQGAKTVSTSAPSGTPADGDIWYRY